MSEDYEIEYPSDEVIEDNIKNKLSFAVVKMSGISELMKYCFKIEKTIHDNHMSCRVKTKGRTIVGLPFIFLPPGWVYYGIQFAHNLVTLNPDWKITRNFFSRRIEVKYCGAE